MTPEEKRERQREYDQKRGRAGAVRDRGGSAMRPAPAAGHVPRIGMGGACYDGASTIEWWTPPHVFTALGLNFDLDPCAPPLPAAPWIPAARRISLPANGLEAPWQGRIWLNPPYGRETQAWVTKLAQHGDGAALVFARTDARWAQQAMRHAQAVCFIGGRLSFLDGTVTRGRKGHNAAAASMLLAYGPACAAAVMECGLGMAYGVPKPPPIPGDGMEPLFAMDTWPAP